MDLFSGERTALAAFKDWDIDYVEIRDGVDIRDFKPERLYDFIWASPPCNEYSRVNPRNRFKVPDRTYWYEAFRCIDRGKKTRQIPWVIENVSGAQNWFGRARDICCNAWYFWGFYPPLKLPKNLQKSQDWGEHSGNKTSRARSMIPYEISKAFYEVLS